MTMVVINLARVFSLLRHSNFELRHVSHWS